VDLYSALSWIYL